MKDIIIAYPSKNIALQLKGLLDGEGYHVSYVCARGSSVLGIARQLNDGVVLCASILGDMSAEFLAENLPAGFDVVSLSKNGREEYAGNLITLPLPINKSDLLQTVSVLVSTRSAFTQRSESDAELLTKAKLVLMNTNGIGESQAHKYLQRESMRTGKKITQLAKEIVNDFAE